MFQSELRCSKRFIVILTLAGFFLFVNSAVMAVVIRHDKTDADAIRLGKDFDAAGKVLPDGGCTLIAPTWAVTAAHVARSMREGSKVDFGGKEYTVKRVIIHPEGTGRPGRPPAVDLALIEFTKAVEGVDPLKIYTDKKELGKTLYIVGYGDFGNPKSPLTHTDGKRRAVTNVVDDAGPKRIFLGFEEPPKGTEYEGIGGPGDSGGPALLKDGDNTYLVGISSGSMNGKPGQYGVIDVYTRVSTYEDWIEENMKPEAVGLLSGQDRYRILDKILFGDRNKSFINN